MKKIFTAVVIAAGLIFSANRLYDIWCEGLNDTWRYMGE